MYTHITCHKYPTVANEMIGELRMVVDAAGDPLLLLLEGSVLLVLVLVLVLVLLFSPLELPSSPAIPPLPSTQLSLARSDAIAASIDQTMLVDGNTTFHRINIPSNKSPLFW
jgi:hypothetical protein